MRLSPEMTRVIQDAFVQVFERGDLYLFGSRVESVQLSVFSKLSPK
ncbi:MAG: hypothetical protein HQM07_09500 [Zetaproteobacteria bacterium]|nr:hypothetical protein [Zetaproteobacteria bacterium]